MTQAKELDLGPLTWVKSEIDLALTRAAECVSEASRTSDAASRIQFAQTHLHQVRGALSIVGLDGLTQFASSLDQLLGAMGRGEVETGDDQLALVGRALASIGNYLEELAHGTPDQPLRLLPLYREIATARAHGLPSAADLFFPDTSLRAPRRTQSRAPDPATLQSAIKPLRSRFQRGLLDWLKMPGADSGIDAMRAALDELEAIEGNPPYRALWWVGQAVVDTLGMTHEGEREQVKRLLSRLEAQLRRLGGAPQPLPERLLREMLYQVACHPALTPTQQAVVKNWQLDDLLPEPGSRVSELPLAPLLQDLRGRLSEIKEQWDAFSAGAAIALPRFETALDEFATSASLLGRPAIDRLVAGIQRFTQWLRKDPLHSSDAIAIEMATALLLAEAGLDRSVPDAGFSSQVAETTARLDALSRGEHVEATENSPGLQAARRAQEKEALGQLAREILSSLANIEQTLDDFFRDQGKRAPLGQLSGPLHQIEGALSLLGETDAIELIKHAGETIASFAANDAPADPIEFEALAHKLSALGFFIQSLQYGKASLQQFLDPDAVRATAPEEESPLLPETASISTTPPPAAADAEAAPAGGELGAEAASEIELHGDAADDEPAQREVAAVPPLAEDTRRLLEASEEEIDAELLCIFIEEAYDVLETIGEQLELSRTEPSNTDCLTAIRRGFHTLKGSGRMVGLRDLGEAAWELEQTLNRWLQLEWPPTSALHHLIDEAHQHFSAWVQQLEHSGRQFRDVAALLAEAIRLRESETPTLESDVGRADAVSHTTDIIETTLDFDLSLSDEGEVLPYEGGPSEAPHFLPEETSLEDFPLIDAISDFDPGSTGTPRMDSESEHAPVGTPARGTDAFEKDDSDAIDEFELEIGDVEELNVDSAADEASDTTESAPELLQITALDESWLPSEDDVPAPGDDTTDETPADAQAAESDLLQITALDSTWLPSDETGEPGADETAPGAATEEDDGDLMQFTALDEDWLPPLDDDAEPAAPAPVADATEGAPVPPAVVSAEDVLEAASTSAAEPEPATDASGTPEYPPMDEAASEDAAGIEPAAEPEVDADLPADATRQPAAAEPATAAEQAQDADFVRVGDVEISRPLYDLYIAEARHHIATLHQEFGRLKANPTLQLPETALRAAHTFAGISGTARVAPLHTLARALEHAEQRLRDHSLPPSADNLALFCTALDTLEAMLAEVASKHMPLDAPELVDQLDQAGRIALTTASVPPQTSAPPGAAQHADDDTPVHVTDEVDEQLLPIFLEEASEILGDLHANLRSWKEDADSADKAKSVARLLHTLKGSARMTGAMLLGEQIHQLESRLESALKGGGEIEAFIDELATNLDQTEQLIDGLAGGQDTTPPTSAVPAQAAAPLAGPAVSIDAAPSDADSGAGSATLRVRAELLDRFVNEAGEIGVARSRIEGELRNLRRSMLDLTENVIRLRNQLREVEIQADVQMQSRIAQAESHHAEFDPLEMDRYTRLQELTRMMAESVNDVTTVQQSLLRNLDGADLALHSQARLSRELQQALMQVRMVPFDSLADRLYRIVRKSAKELGKRANLDLRGGRIEIDRSVLEHMVAPLEHLLRNALAHGIEAPELRRNAGKPEIGQITLSVSQEGNEIVLELADDGGGLNFDSIAAKARANGLLGADEVADERRLTNLIFVPGFSTAGALSAVSGRGVGMDVVKAETAAVGGRIDVSSAPDSGTVFRIYLPLTLAVTQALLVRAAGRHFAIPSSMIAQVMELKADALERLRHQGGTDWMGQHYAYRYLPRLLGDTASQPEIQRYNWMLLLRAGAQTLALHVDALRGNEEIIVKNAGPQLTRIVGMSGATVLGDGEIVLILNPVALASRSLGSAEGEQTDTPPPQAAPDPQHIPTVMVVDDSLTVRKITGRLLEREGYRVITAKDGVDAIEILADIVPDVMLCDIEMPRMDGFDLVRNVRADARTKAIPVIMITSRLADKHRSYAMEIGANHYLGKPYQEEELLGLIAGYAGGSLVGRPRPA